MSDQRDVSSTIMATAAMLVAYLVVRMLGAAMPLLPEFAAGYAAAWVLIRVVRDDAAKGIAFIASRPAVVLFAGGLALLHTRHAAVAEATAAAHGAVLLAAAALGALWAAVAAMRPQETG